MRGDRGQGQRGRHREGGGRGGAGEGALDVCNLLIEEHSEVISSDGGLRWWVRYTEERREEKIENS